MLKDVKGKVAFITGGASGCGLGMARVFAEAGMKVAIADIRRSHLDEALKHFMGKEKDVHAIKLDVSDRAAMARAADEVERVFGKVHLVCNNAGINVFGPMIDATYADWDWLTNVNLHGVINGVVTFIPRIRKHGEGGHIVNTASMASFVSGPGAGIYTMTKFAVRGLSECLWYDLAPHNIGVSVLCPGLVKSNIYRTEELRPKEFGASGYTPNEEMTKRLGEVHELGMDPLEIGRKVLAAVRRADFYILTHPDHGAELREIFDEILAAVPKEEPEPGRMAFEDIRRQGKAEGRKKGRAGLGLE
jgi:NAD(P)-dependent dehydrogenase (short-subunit alcohol dehydrogenase family)